MKHKELDLVRRLQDECQLDEGDIVTDKVGFVMCVNRNLGLNLTIFCIEWIK